MLTNEGNTRAWRLFSDGTNVAKWLGLNRPESGSQTYSPGDPHYSAIWRRPEPAMFKASALSIRLCDSN